MDLVEARLNTQHRHPWELSRLDNILPLGIGEKKIEVCADIGAGDCFFSKSLREALPLTTIYSIDINYPASSTSDHLIRLRDLSELPTASVDVVYAMDVLEHVEDDAAFMREMVRCVKPGGTLVITVPAFQFLFSEHDVFLRHFRRYSRRQLLQVAASADLQVEYSFYFFSALFFMRSLEKIAAALLGAKVGTDRGIGGWSHPKASGVTRIVRGVLNFDFQVCRFLARINIRLPGLSLCMKCRKRYV